MNHGKIILGLCLFFLEGCSPLYTDHVPVPPVRAERVPSPPKSPFVLIWQPGHYDWNHSSYIWVSGKWVRRAGHGTLWQDGYWKQTGQKPVWVPAHWI